MTPLPGKGFNPGQAAGLVNGGMGTNGAQANGQSAQQAQAAGMMQQTGQGDLGVAGFGMDGGEFILPDFSMEPNTDVLENFDFDAFLNNTDATDGLANFADFTNFDGVGDVAAADALGQ